MSNIPSDTPVFAEGLPITFRDQTIWRDPTDFDESFLIDLDFDETCFTTFISSGDGVEVHEAYEIAVETVLGNTARVDFSNYGGLSNRAPLDVIQGLIEADSTLVRNALRHSQDHFAHPEDISDIGLGLIARFADRDKAHCDELTIRAITEMLVIRKKEKLIPQISGEWPLPVKGFDEFWLDLHDKRSQGGPWEKVHTAIVSSGHSDFIRQTLEIFGLPHPDIYMTDDEMRRQVHPRTKPDPYALSLVENAWMNAYVVPQSQRSIPGFLEETRRRQMYTGDDQNKDGQMAEGMGIRYEHHDGTAEAWLRISKVIVQAVESGEGFARQ